MSPILAILLAACGLLFGWWVYRVLDYFVPTPQPAMVVTGRRARRARRAP